MNSMQSFAHIIGIFGACIGIGVSLYIYIQKKRKQSLICPRDRSCDTVVNSTYSTTWGIRNEILGASFYAMLLISFLSMSIAPMTIASVVVAIGAILGICFSLYFLYIQYAILHMWCLWCLGSALATILIAYASSTLYTASFVSFLADTKVFWVIIQDRKSVV